MLHCILTECTTFLQSVLYLSIYDDNSRFRWEYSTALKREKRGNVLQSLEEIRRLAKR